MAEFSARGLDELMLDLAAIAEIPEDVQDEMLISMAEIVAAAQRKKARAYGVQDSGLTIRKIKPGKIKMKKGVRTIYVTPTGTRKRGEQRVRNAEIAFVNEYGTTSQKARPFVRDGNAASAAESTAAAFEIYDRFLQSKNL